MGELPISRDEALELLKKYNKEESDMNHYLESEAVLRGLAEKLGEDVEIWGFLGLLHDIDWGITKEKMEEHLTKAPKILKEAGFSEEFIEIVLSHGYGFSELPGFGDKKRTKKAEFALACGETITGLVHAYALMRQGRVSDMEVKGLKKKFKDKNFAAGVERKIIRECEELGLSLDEFFEIAIASIGKIKGDVGLN